MSEEKKTTNMFGSADMTTRFCDIVAGHLEDMASSGDLNGCLEVIKFLRRFIADVPVTDYRTVGFPSSIKTFLDACGLEQDKDYRIETSSLDKESHVVSFKRSEHTEMLLGCIAGLRVGSGPSVCDKLYCELCKEKDRNFRDSLVGSELGERADFRSYLLGKTGEIYTKLANEFVARKKAIEAGSYKPIGSAADEELEMQVLEYASKQVSDGKLLPTATPVVPIAVAECYYRFMQRRAGDLAKSDLVLFRLGKKPEEWVSARPLSSLKYAPSLAMSASPLQVLRKYSKAFDGFMPTDAYTFNTAECQSGAVADCAYVMAGSLLRFPAEDTETTVRLFNIIESRRDLMSYVCSIYSTCYTGLDMAFYSASGVRLPVGSKYKKESEATDTSSKGYKVMMEADELLGLSVTDESPELVLTSAFILSPFVSAQNMTMFEKTEKTAVVVRNAKKESSGKKPAKGKHVPSVADYWFNLVHNVKAPEFTDEEASTKMEAFLTEAAASTEEGALPTAIAIGIRSAIAKLQEKSGSSKVKSLPINTYVKNADKNGLHTNEKFITQLISTVTGPGSKNLQTFVKGTESGQILTPPAFPQGDYLFPSTSTDAVSKFIGIADQSNLQLRMPRRISDFVIYAETNISADTLTEIYETTAGFTKTTVSGICKEVKAAMFAGINDWPSTSFAKVKKELGAHSAVMKTYDAIVNGVAESESLFNVSIESDKHGRAVIVLRVDKAAAFLAMLFKAPVGDLDGLIAAAINYDPASVFLSEENWKAELCDYLFEETRNMSGGKRLPRSETIGWSIYRNDCYGEDEFITSDISIRSMLMNDVVDGRFRYLVGKIDGSQMDPN